MLIVLLPAQEFTVAALRLLLCCHTLRNTSWEIEGICKKSFPYWLCVFMQVVNGFLGSCAAALVKIPRTHQVWKALQKYEIRWSTRAVRVPVRFSSSNWDVHWELWLPQCRGGGFTGGAAVAGVWFRTWWVWVWAIGHVIVGVSVEGLSYFYRVLLELSSQLMTVAWNIIMWLFSLFFELDKSPSIKWMAKHCPYSKRFWSKTRCNKDAAENGRSGGEMAAVTLAAAAGFTDQIQAHPQNSRRIQSLSALESDNEFTSAVNPKCRHSSD